MRSRSLLVTSVSVASSFLLVSCLLKEKQETTIVKKEVPVGGRYVVGAFEGTFSIADTRVIAAKEKFELVVAKLADDDETVWMRSFSSVAPGRAVVHGRIHGGGVWIVGILSERLTLDQPRYLLDPRDKNAIFFLIVTPEGRVHKAELVANGTEFSAPKLTKRTDGRSVVSIPYEGRAELRGKPVMEGPSARKKAHLQFEVTGAGEIVNEQVVADSKAMKAMGSLEKTEKASESGGLRLASMLQASTCNICDPKAAMYGDDCIACSTQVAGADSWCYHTGWDRNCIVGAKINCPASTRRCDCPHDTCTEDVLLFPGCALSDSTHSDCVNRIDASDPFCGQNKWDASCISHNFPECGRNCMW